MSPTRHYTPIPAASFWELTSYVCGWLYFTAWSVSFYGQPSLNWNRKSTEGVLIDFPLANVIGFFFYSTSNLMLYFSTNVRKDYARHYPDAPLPTVRFNDVFFAVHALCICIVTLSMYSEQIWGFKQGSHRLAKSTKLMVTACLLAAAWSVLMTCNGGWSWLDVTNVLGYCKLALTIAKYVPQAIANYQRKSTVGWSISQVLLDFAGGILSVAQLLIDSRLQGDWSGIFGNPAKWMLGNVSLLFDVLFMTQHYLLYPARNTSPEVNRSPERERLLSRRVGEDRLD